MAGLMTYKCYFYLDKIVLAGWWVSDMWWVRDELDGGLVICGG